MVILIGTVGQDAKTGTTKNGKTWSRVSLATQKRAQDGSYATCWHNVVGWGKEAERLAKLKKRDVVFIQGELDYYDYKNKEGKQVKGNQVLAKVVLAQSGESEPEIQYKDDVEYQGDIDF